MAKKSGNSFGNFQGNLAFKPNGIKPITTEFSKGSVPDSIYAANRESAWSRWRRGYELATASFYDNYFQYPFKYVIPVSPGTPGSITNPQPTVSGAFVGFPTKKKELGMHWAGWRYAGSLRCDKITDPVTSQKLFIESVTEDANYWYVKLAGTWSPATISNTTSGTYTFTPTPGLCATTTTLDVTVTPNVTPTFNAIPAFLSKILE